MAASDVYFREDCKNPSSFLPPNQDAKPTPNTTHAWEIYNANGLKQVTYAGRAAARFEVNKSWGVDAKEDYRMEVTLVKAEEDSRVTETGWYGYRLLFPTNGGGADSRKTSHNQWFEDGSDELTMRTMNGICFLELQNGGKTYRWDLYSSAKTTDGTTTGFVKHPLEQWDQRTYHIKHHLTDGFIKVYFGDQLVHSYTGPTIHEKIPKLKIGEYSSAVSSQLPYKVVYFTDIVVGNDKATLADMIGSGGTVEPPIEPPVPADEYKVVACANQEVLLPANTAKVTADITGLTRGVYKAVVLIISGDNSEIRDETTITVKGEDVPVPPEPPVGGSLITGFSLINADTEKSVADITEGGVYDLSDLGVKKANLEAITDPSVTSVAFSCTGPSPKEFNDKGAPFTLMGDGKRSDGSINYNYGTWGPPLPGPYTVTATPSVGSAVKSSVTINFTIKA